MKIKSFKGFSEKILKMDQNVWYGTLKENISKAKIAFENYKKDITFNDCDEEKILKIFSLLRATINYTALNQFCTLLSKKDLKDIQSIKVPDIRKISKEQLKKEYHNIKSAGYMKKSKENNKNNFRMLVFLLNALLINYELLSNILKDNKIIVEKLQFFSEDELKYMNKNHFVLSLVKYIPKESLKKISQKIAAVDKKD
jgi:hypothetical protein